MLTDKQLFLSNAQEFDVATSTPEITENVYDTGPLASGNTGVGVGDGKPTLYGYIRVSTDFTASGGAANATFTLESSAAEALTSTTEHWSSGAIAKGTLVAGYAIKFTLNPGENWKRYIGGRVTADTNDFDTGNVDWFITDNVDVFNVYASGLNFSI